MGLWFVLALCAYAEWSNYQHVSKLRALCEFVTENGDNVKYHSQISVRRFIDEQCAAALSDDEDEDDNNIPTPF